MALSVEDITGLFATRGAAQYGGEAINQLQHGLQCAHLAELAGATPELVSASLLHDLGHMLSDQETGQELAKDDIHQFVVLPFLRGVFPDAVIEPIRLHVDAKRYLCATDAAYWAALSPASQRSLELQGGSYSKTQAAAFIAQPFAADAVALRRWDDLAKNPQAQPPAWSHYLPVLQHCLVRQAPGSPTQARVTLRESSKV